MIVPQIISDPKLIHRKETLLKELARQRIETYELWPSIHLPLSPRRTSISKAHKQIVEWAANEGLEEVAIFEDDIWFPSPYGWQYFIANKPKFYDLYLSGITRGEIINGKVRRYTGQYGYFIHEKYYDTFLRTDEKLDIDGAQSGRGDFHVCYPFAAFCYPGFSVNQQGVVDYSHLLIGREIHGFGLMNDKADAKRFSDAAKALM